MTGQQLNLFNAAHSRPRPRKTEKDPPPPPSPLDIAWGDKVAEWFRVTEDGELRPWLMSSWGADLLPPEDNISDNVFALVCQVLDAADTLGMRAANLVYKVEAELLASIAKRDELVREFWQEHPEDPAAIRWGESAP